MLVLIERGSLQRDIIIVTLTTDDNEYRIWFCDRCSLYGYFLSLEEFFNSLLFDFRNRSQSGS